MRPWASEVQLQRHGITAFGSRRPLLDAKAVLLLLQIWVEAVCCSGERLDSPASCFCEDKKQADVD